MGDLDTRTIVVEPEPLTEDGFRPFGTAIAIPPREAEKRDENWDCWFHLATLGACTPAVGIVLTRPGNTRVTRMERELKPELVVPVSGAIVQAVAPPGRLDVPERPDAGTVRAFVVRPGEAILMAPGTWHWAALPLGDDETLYYFVTEPVASAQGALPDPWIPFSDGRAVDLRIPAEMSGRG